MYKNLKLFRESLGMTQKSFAKELGIGITTYNGYETGARDPKSDFWIMVAKKYNITIDYLMGFSDSPYKTSSAGDTFTFEEQAHIKKYRILDVYGKKAVDSVLSAEYERLMDSAANPAVESNVIPFRVSTQSASAGKGTYLGPEEFETIMVEDNALTRQASFGVPVRGDSMEPIYHDGDILLVKGAEVAIGEIGIFTLEGDGYVKKRGNNELISLNPAYAPIPMSDSIHCNGKVIGVLEKDWIQ